MSLVFTTNDDPFGLTPSINSSAKFDGDSNNAVKDDFGVGDDVHIRIQPRTNRKSMTTIENLYEHVNNPEKFKRMIKYFRKKFCCTCTIMENNCLKLTGDQRENLKKFLVKQKIVDEDQIVIHGY